MKGGDILELGFLQADDVEVVAREVGLDINALGAATQTALPSPKAKGLRVGVRHGQGATLEEAWGGRLDAARYIRRRNTGRTKARMYT